MSDKKATTIDEQIVLLCSRGMIIDDKQNARKVLLDIGFYGLGFYAFPFEQTFPEKSDRDHIYKEGTHFDDVLALWKFDYQLRSLLTNALNRIETNIRTFISYTCSIKYKENPIWFVDPSVLKNDFVSTFDEKVYSMAMKNPVIKRHHSKYMNHKYAPAWKTLEFITLGSLCKMYESVKDKKLKLEISQRYGCTVGVFVNYLHSIRYLRNECAHGGCIYDIALPTGICKGPAGDISGNMRHNINGIILVLEYVLGRVSSDLKVEFRKNFGDLLFSINNDKLKEAIRICGGFVTV